MLAESKLTMTENSTAFVSSRRQMQGYKSDYFKTDSFHRTGKQKVKDNDTLRLSVRPYIKHGIQIYTAVALA
jgi:hypothetical protein